MTKKDQYRFQNDSMFILLPKLHVVKMQATTLHPTPSMQLLESKRLLLLSGCICPVPVVAHQEFVIDMVIHNQQGGQHSTHQ